MNDEYILKKSVDWSLFNRGFAIPVEMQAVFSLHLSAGILRHGEQRTVNLILNGVTHQATLTSVNFDRTKYPEHSDIWQIIYPKNGSFAVSIRKIFAGAFNALLEIRQQQSNRQILDNSESIVLYTTDLPDTFYVEPLFADEIQALPNEQTEQNLENLFELPSLTDSETALIEKYRLTKIRKLNRSIGNYLKKLYNFRCQICGQNVGEVYGAKVVECHHINYFVQSLNNDADNLLIVCPNHHRIIHAANPNFDSENKVYHYPNGYVEGLKLNLHL